MQRSQLLERVRHSLSPTYDGPLHEVGPPVPPAAEAILLWLVMCLFRYTYSLLHVRFNWIQLTIPFDMKVLHAGRADGVLESHVTVSYCSEPEDYHLVLQCMFLYICVDHRYCLSTDSLSMLDCDT